MSFGEHWKAGMQLCITRKAVRTLISIRQPDGMYNSIIQLHNILYIVTQIYKLSREHVASTNLLHLTNR